MTEKILGKITFAEFGTVRDYPFLIGLQLRFGMNYGSIGDDGRYTINSSPYCKWNSTERTIAITKMVDKVNELLKDAKVNYVSQLVGKPVEVTITNNTFDGFRILTEVL